MMMTIQAHEANLSLLDQFYANPELFTGESTKGQKDTFCHLSVFGPTSHRFNGLDSNCTQVISYRDIRHELAVLKRDPSVDKIFIELSGPGGEVEGCFDLAEYISELGKIKPVIGFINGSSYSANYALASACTELYASPHSMGGSIGVIRGRLEIINDRRKMTYYTTGEAKADGAPDTPLDKAEAARHQAMVDELGEVFFAHVAKQRPISAEAVKKLQAKLFSAKAMLAHGLIDGIKTEEEIQMMMKTSTHEQIVSDMQANHQQETASLKEQLIQLQTEANDNAATQAATIAKINNLAQSAGVPEVAGKLIEDQADEQAAAKAITTAAAEKDEELSLTSGVDTPGAESYDMQQLIKDA